MASESTPKKLQNELSMRQATIAELKFETEADVEHLVDNVNVVEQELENLQSAMEGIVHQYIKTKVKMQDDCYDVLSILGKTIRGLEDKCQLLSDGQLQCCYCYSNSTVTDRDLSWSKIHS